MPWDRSSLLAAQWLGDQEKRQLMEELRRSATQRGLITNEQIINDLFQQAGVPREDVDLQFGKIPMYVDRAAAANYIGKTPRIPVRGVTMFRGSEYPMPVKYPAMIAIDSENVQEEFPKEPFWSQMATLRHELEHVKEQMMGFEQPREKYSLENVAGSPHFGHSKRSDSQTFEGKQALEKFLNRFKELK